MAIIDLCIANCLRWFGCVALSMRPKGTAAELEARRRIAGQLLLEGKKIAEVAQLVKASVSAVKQWKRALNQQGMDALKSKPHPGAKPRLTAQQKQRLVRILLKGPTKQGYRTQLWTCRRVAEVIRREFGVEYHHCHVWKLLRSMNWSPQKPEQRARERDDTAIARWRNQTWPDLLKKGARRR